MKIGGAQKVLFSNELARVVNLLMAVEKGAVSVMRQPLELIDRYDNPTEIDRFQSGLLLYQLDNGFTIRSTKLQVIGTGGKVVVQNQLLGGPPSR